MKVWLGYLFLLALDASYRARAEHRDLILQAICAANCNKAGRDCREECFKGPIVKAGNCGNSSDPFLNSCLVECSSDKDCASLDKCCSHQCGRTCQPPHDLLSIPDLPSIPENVTLLQTSETRKVMVNWTHPGEAQFVIEFREESGPWVPAHKGPRVTHPLRIAVRPGVLYTARVAAVNKLGSRGFSKPSNTIIVHVESKPLDPPQELHFKGGLKNGLVSGLLTWQPASPDQVVSKYAVHWTQRFVVQDSLRNKGSVQVHKKTVPQGKTCIRVKNLHLNSTCTFEVQAIMFIGKEKFTSKKATLTVDTSGFTSMSKRGAKQKTKDFHVYHKIINTKDGLSVKISWPVRERSKFAVSWKTECDSKTYSVVTTGSHYVINDVKKNCHYQVFIKEKSECKKRRKLGKLAFKIT